MQEVCMKFRCVWSIVLILGLAAAGTQAEAAGDRAVIAHSAYDLEEKGNQEFSTRSLFTEDWTGKQETTFFFNDGFGRLTEFHEYTEGARIFLIIRQNMNVVWQGSCRVTDHRFSVYRRESNGRVYFQIRMGQHEYSAEIGRDDRWTVTESGLPVASDPIELSWNA